MAHTSITPFRIDIASEAISEIEHKLRLTRWPDELPGKGWSLGADLDYMKSLHTYWLDQFNWRNVEDSLNKFDHFKYSHQGKNIHFIHKQGSGRKPMPLILTHGFPGCFAEFLKIIPLLTEPEMHGGAIEDSFSVVIPSLPGYGFSDRPDESGVNVQAIAGIWTSLMSELGYDRFGAQGGDWGSWVSTLLGLNYPDRIIGLHLNYISTGFRPFIGAEDPPLSSDEADYLDRVANWREAEGAYAAIQATKPQTLAYGMSDSPMALAAWLIDKFESWSDCDGDPDNAFTKDELITNVMIYWLTNTAGSAFHLYAEARAKPLHLVEGEYITPPCGVIRSPKELPLPPRRWAERAFKNLTRWTEAPRGGHFAAMEIPELLAEDIRLFFRPLRDHSW